MWRNTAAIMMCAAQWCIPRMMKPNGMSFMIVSMDRQAGFVRSPEAPSSSRPSGTEKKRRRIPVIVRTMKAMKEMPPRQQSGYQYQIGWSSYFSAWPRGSWRRSMHPLSADGPGRVLVVLVHDEDHRVVLRAVADAVDRILLELHEGRRRGAVGAVVPSRGRVVDDMPSRVAAKVDAAVEE